MPPKRDAEDVEEEQQLAQLLQNLPPGVVEQSMVKAMEKALGNLVGTSSGFLESLPGPVKARISYLEELQDEYNRLEDELEEQMKELELKYKPFFDELYQKRKEIVCGEKEIPRDPDAAEVAGEDEEEGQEETAGIPDFWLIALRNHEMLDGMMSEKDAEILSFLEDITTTDLEDEDGEDTGYSLTLTFKENDFFSNKSLSISLDVSLDSGIMQVDRLEGTEILWKSDAKNPTIKVMKKKKQGQAKKPPVVKKEKVESFFNIFSPPNLEETAEMEGDEAEEIQGEIEQLLAVCELLREEIIPNAVDWFTGAAIEGEEDEDEDEDDGSDDEYNDEDSDEDEDENAEAPSLQPVDAKDAAECKQQ
eukprot:jgi/Picsp_1/4553/NSC_01923-R1_nucleosome assembly protein